ncbi:MAG: hypothetical protein Q9159_000292 [Coniocarpon cinnabarinum]
MADEVRTPMSEAQDDNFEEAVEEATLDNASNKEKPEDSSKVPGGFDFGLSSTDTASTSSDKQEKVDVPQSREQVISTAQNAETQAPQSESSLQATPTDVYASEGNFAAAHEQADIPENHDAKSNEEKGDSNLERDVEVTTKSRSHTPSASKDSVHSIQTSPQANGHAKTPSLEKTPPTPSNAAPEPENPAHSRQASTELSVPSKQDAPKESAIDDQSSTSAHGEEMDEEQEPPVRRLMRSPFSFFSRSGTVSEKLKSPPLQARRGTASSIATMDGGSAPKQEDAEKSRTPHRNSLKDRFKLLRMQEEAGIKWVGDADSKRPSSSSSGVDMSAMLPPREEEEDEQQEHADDVQKKLRPRTTSAADVLGPAGQPTVREELAPGTAVGTAAGPATEKNQEVDWDLWQAVVYQGPAAVARTSPDELNIAIAAGIPSAIRGVVWQVLAQSSNAELEGIYKELVKRGNDVKQKSPMPSGLSRTTSILRSRPSVLRKNSSPRNRSSSNRRDPSQSNEKTANGIAKHDGAKEAEPDLTPSTSNQSAVASPPSETHVDGSSMSAHTAPTNGVNGHDAQSSNEDKSLDDEEERKRNDEQEKISKLERAIRRDLGARTSYSKFLMSAGLQNGLFGMCKAYALYDEEVGYAQGMNFIAMPLLFNMPEEEAFCLFDRLMKHYHLRDMFVHDMPGLHLHLYQFERLLEDFEPAVYCHLHRRGVTPQLYATQWFLTLFAYRFPLQLVLRIYDLILSEGLESAILKFGIVLMQKNAEKLLEMKDMAVLTTYLKERLFDVYIDKSPSASSVLESGFFGSAGGIDKEVYKADALVQDACAVKVSSELLKQYTREWEEKTREEKAKSAEEDALRSSNQSLSLQVKNLEERSQKFDTEHVQIAQTLVHTQLENQKLSDDNESLRTQIQELRSIVSAQPGEVEEKLRAETERIIQRNAEVQNANRHLEESMTEMENELVASKLKAAQMEEQLEDLRAKWVNISQVMRGEAKGSPKLG